MVGLNGVVLGVGIAGLLVTVAASWISWREMEPRAGRRILLLGLMVSLPFLWAGLFPVLGGTTLALALLTVVCLGGLLFVSPFGNNGLLELGEPTPGVDERDIMFARAVLEPGSQVFEEYYRSHPEFRTKDDLFRMEAGLLSPESAHYHRLGYAASDACFWTIERLRPFVEGAGAERSGVSAGLSEAPEDDSGEGGIPGNLDRKAPHEADPAQISRFLKGWLLKQGAHSVGITRLRDYHLYTHVGRGPERGDPVRLDHSYALAFTVEMDRQMVDPAPRSPTIMESALQYLNAGVMAVQVADLIGRLGYRARAHVDGSYRVICPLVARDAGLGELGRMGLVMTPGLGPRVRIAVVTTDIPLVCDEPFQDSTMLDFCLQCRKCAESCPSHALPLGDPEKDEGGVLRWKIDAEACFTLWTKMGTDCARCMSVCPYSHPDNLLHNVVRWGIGRNSLFRRAAVKMDDLIYGERPLPKGSPDWMP